MKELVVRDCNFFGVTPEEEETPVADVTMDGSANGAAAVLDEQWVWKLTERAQAESRKPFVIGLPSARGPEDVKALTHETSVQWFDAQTAGPIERDAAVALEIWNLWRRHHGRLGLSNGQ